LYENFNIFYKIQFSSFSLIPAFTADRTHAELLEDNLEYPYDMGQPALMVFDLLKGRDQLIIAKHVHRGLNQDWDKKYNTNDSIILNKQSIRL
jgi:hypothetical protein